MRGIADPCPAVKTTDLCAVHTLSKKKNVFLLMETTASFFSCGFFWLVDLYYIYI